MARLHEALTVVGLTGSQGRTSAKDLLAAVLASAAPTIATIGSVNNELGVPLTMLRAGTATRFLAQIVTISTIIRGKSGGPLTLRWARARAAHPTRPPP